MYKTGNYNGAKAIMTQEGICGDENQGSSEKKPKSNSLTRLSYYASGKFDSAKTAVGEAADSVKRGATGAVGEVATKIDQAATNVKQKVADLESTRQYNRKRDAEVAEFRRKRATHEAELRRKRATDEAELREEEKKNRKDTYVTGLAEFRTERRDNKAAAAKQLIDKAAADNPNKSVLGNIGKFFGSRTIKTTDGGGRKSRIGRTLKLKQTKKSTKQKKQTRKPKKINKKNKKSLKTN